MKNAKERAAELVKIDNDRFTYWVYVARCRLLAEANDLEGAEAIAKIARDAIEAVIETAMVESMPHHPNIPDEPIPSYGDHMTLDEFVEICKSGGFVDYDGTGYYATATHMTRERAYPSKIRDGVIDRTYTHVMWFNK